jgi:carbohydrate kinase (thermoresistant glucokinase family)
VSTPQTAPIPPAPPADAIAPRILVMGVSGCGKSSLGQALAISLGLRYLEGDDFHPEANVRKMAGGTPLTDADRAGWLDALAAALVEPADAGVGLVLSCSALKRAYRDRLRRAAPALRVVHLHGDPGLLAERLARRRDHYMPASLLHSQLATLEAPAPDEQALVLDIARPLDELLAQALARLGPAVLPPAP